MRGQLVQVTSALSRDFRNSRVLRDGAWVFCGRTLTGVINIATGALLARLLSPDLFGAYFLILGVTTILAVLAQGGVSQIALRAIARAMGVGRLDEARAVAARALQLVLACALLIGGIAASVGSWFSSDFLDSAVPIAVVWIASVWVIPIALQCLLGEVFRGFHDIRGSTVFGGLLAALVSFVVLGAYWLVVESARLSEVIVLVVGAHTLCMIAGAVALHRRISKLPLASGGPIAFTLDDTIPFVAYHLSLVALAQADVLAIGMFRSHEEVAAYAAAAKLVTIVALPLWVLNAVVLPVIAQYNAQGRMQELECILRTGATWAGLFALTVFAVYAIAGGEILNAFFGPFYAAGWTPLLLLASGQLANVLTGSCGPLLAMAGHHRVIMWITVSFGSLTVAAAVLAAPVYGATAVAAIWALSLIIQNLVTLVVARRLTGIWTHVLVSPLWWRGARDRK